MVNKFRYILHSDFRYGCDDTIRIFSYDYGAFRAPLALNYSCYGVRFTLFASYAILTKKIIITAKIDSSRIKLSQNEYIV